MKKIVGILSVTLFIFFTAQGASAQPVEGKRFEFSTSASLYNIKYEWWDEADTIINIPIRIGFFIFGGLEIEPELFLTIPTDETDDTGVFFLSNVSYNFKVSDRMIAFILGGIGTGNGTQTYFLARDMERSIAALNFGAGIKCIVGNSAGIRIEYRFTRYSREGELYRTDNNVYLGLSIFF